MQVVSYIRVSTAAQGRSGLGLEAQREAVQRFCASRGCNVLGEYVEVETGKRDDRPELAKALHHAKVTNATLVVAKLDRLSRNAAFLLQLRDSGAKLVAADNPDVNDMTVGILAVIAQAEREAISQRTSAALQAAKRRGVKLGNPNGARALRRANKGNKAALNEIKRSADEHAADVLPVIEAMRSEGHHSLRAMADGLNERSIRTARGGRWHPATVRNLLARSKAAS
ncbi:recombinase family protein [Sphingomicrobium sediminis]|uniref:Recombinase family protein n=1 Tax=Sphingomicrobium sediminis TaxID=2950949 RepID=A0A9X2EGN2_9SPHN|nr:recombinase family protein [Sphingomicrobium sediminis]MCM8557673.1 recombinase family protein [Sphingomicrobium sediminis]